MPVSLQALKQARRLGSFALSGLLIRARLVLSGQEQSFYSSQPSLPGILNGDIDILAGSVLGLALDAPECSA